MKFSKNSGIRIGRVRYLASQPWPFPSSLMMGFLCEALSEEITIDPDELAEARWFEREEVRAMVERVSFRRPDPRPCDIAAAIGDRPPDCPPLGLRGRQRLVGLYRLAGLDRTKPERRGGEGWRG